MILLHSRLGGSTEPWFCGSAVVKEQHDRSRTTAGRKTEEYFISFY